MNICCYNSIEYKTNFTTFFGIRYFNMLNHNSGFRIPRVRNLFKLELHKLMLVKAQPLTNKQSLGVYYPLLKTILSN